MRPKIYCYIVVIERARVPLRDPIGKGSKISLAKHYKFVMIVHASKEVRAAAISRGCNEVDEVDRPQPGGAGCGRCFSRPAQTLCD